MITKISGIYVIKNTQTNKVYIGSTYHFRKRRKEHRNMLANGRHHSLKLQNSWNKHGGEPIFVFEMIEEVEPNETLLLEREQFWLDFYNAAFDGYNINPNATGCQGKKLSDETKTKMALSKTGERNPNYGKSPSEETRELQRKALKGRKTTEETKQKQSNKYWNKPPEEHEKISEMRKGEKNPFYGKKHSEEILRKIADKNRGKKRTTEDKIKISKSQFDKISKLNTSGYVGVSLLKTTGRYRATIRWNNKFKHIGYYDTAQEASIAREQYIKDNKIGE